MTNCPRRKPILRPKKCQIRKSTTGLRNRLSRTLT